MAEPKERMEPDESMDLADALMLDANAFAGLLMDVFGWDMTAEESKCANCGNVGAGGTLLAFAGPGTTLRCSVCREVVVRIVQTPDATYVDVRGATYLRVPTAPSASSLPTR